MKLPITIRIVRSHGNLPPVPVDAAPRDDPWLALASGPLTADLCECDALCECEEKQ